MQTEGGDIQVGDSVWRILWREKYLPEFESDDGYKMDGTLFDIIEGSRKPSMIYFYSSSMPAEKRLAIERKMFSQPAVIFASRFFNCIRIDADEIEDQNARARYAPRVPSFYFYTSTGETVAKSNGPLSPKSLVQAMHDAYHADYDKCISSRLQAIAANVRDQTRLSISLAEAQQILAEQLTKADKRNSAARQRKVTQTRQRIDAIDLQLAQLKERAGLLLMAPPLKADTDEEAGG